MSNLYPTLLVVDDSPIFRHATVSYLRSNGFTILFEALNGQQALDCLPKAMTLPDICLLDVEMPILNGYETARRLRKEYPSIKILAYTLFPDRNKESDLLAAGADAVLVKYAEPQELVANLLQLHAGDPMRAFAVDRHIP